MRSTSYPRHYSRPTMRTASPLPAVHAIASRLLHSARLHAAHSKKSLCKYITDVLKTSAGAVFIARDSCCSAADIRVITLLQNVNWTEKARTGVYRLTSKFTLLIVWSLALEKRMWLQSVLPVIQCTWNLLKSLLYHASEMHLHWATTNTNAAIQTSQSKIWEDPHVGRAKVLLSGNWFRSKLPQYYVNIIEFNLINERALRVCGRLWRSKK